MLFYCIIISFTAYMIGRLDKNNKIKNKIKQVFLNYLNLDTNEDFDYFEETHYLRWNFQKVVIDVPMAVYTIDFMGYHFRISMTLEKTKDGKYYVSFYRKLNQQDELEIFDGKNLVPITKSFNTQNEAEVYLSDMKKYIPELMMKDSCFQKFSKENCLAIL